MAKTPAKPKKPAAAPKASEAKTLARAMVAILNGAPGEQGYDTAKAQIEKLAG